MVSGKIKNRAIILNKLSLFFNKIIPNELLKNVFLLCILITHCYSCNFADKEPENLDDITLNNSNEEFRVPLSVKNDFLKQNKGINLVEKENFAKLFWDFYDQDINPSESYTDINNDQVVDYAFLIRENDKLKIAVAYSDKKEYSYWISPFALEEITPVGIHFCVTAKPAGRTDVVKKKPESLVLKKNGFAINNLEQEAKVLYELNGKIQLFELQ
jgi:hypothetical protein